MKFNEWWAINGHSLWRDNSMPASMVAETAWDAATAVAIERAAKVAEDMRPMGGRMLSETQYECFDALTETAKAIRALLEEEGEE